MQQKTTSSHKQSYLKSSILILLAFSSAFFPRLLDTFGFPSIINFIHFITVFLASGITLFTNRNQNKNELLIVKKILLGLFIFLLIIIISAVINNAGAINALLSFILLVEPFALLVAIIVLPLSYEKFYRFRKWLISMLFFHMFIAMVQKYVLGVDNWEHLPMTGGDRIQGVFFISGAGHTVGASVSLTFGVYYLISAKANPLWFRIVVLLTAFWQMVLADAKQVLLSFIIAALILTFIKLNNFTKSLQYLVMMTIFGLGFAWCLQNVEAFRSFNTWIRPEIYGLDGEATLLKISTFRVVPNHYHSVLNWFFGLGPGHTVGRLGGWMLRSYADLLNPLGATRHIASIEVWQEVGSSWLGDQSSMFSPLFGWAGIWGDLGIVGLVVYLYLGFLIWKFVCKDDLCKFLLLTVFVFGLIFSQMEEPAYMLCVASIIGLRWQENKFSSQTPHLKI